MSQATCPFCALPESAYVWHSPLSFAIRDRYPVSPGHTLIIPRRHAGTWFSFP